MFELLREEGGQERVMGVLMDVSKAEDGDVRDGHAEIEVSR